MSKRSVLLLLLFASALSSMEAIGAHVPSRLLALDDVNGNGSPDIAVLVRDSNVGTLTAYVKDTMSGAVIRTVAFSTDMSPVRFLAVPDMNGNGVQELAVLGADAQGSPRVEVRDGQSGGPIATVTFNPELTPVDLAVVPTEAESPQLAMLGLHPTKNYVVVITKDVATDAKISVTGFNPNFYPYQLLALPDVDTNGEPEFAVLGAGPIKVEVRNSGGALLRNVWMGWPYYKTAQIAMLDDMDGDSHPDLATFEQDYYRGAEIEFAKVINLRTGTAIHTEGFNPWLTPIKFIPVPDLDGNGASELAVLGIIYAGNNYRTKAEIHDSVSDRVVNVWFGPAYSPEDMVTLPDMNGNGLPELAMLGKRHTDGQLKAFIKDASTGELINAVDFVKLEVKGRMVAAGHYGACAIKLDRSVVCWGTFTSEQSGTFAQVDVGNISCGIKADGNLSCWDGWSEPDSLPAGEFTQVSVGEDRACGVRLDGSVACWVKRGWGTLEPPAGTFTHVAVYGHACGVRTDGSLACWGRAADAPPTGTFSQVAAGRGFMCGLRVDGEITCWTPSDWLVLTAPPGPFTQISAGGQYACGLRADKTIACFGNSSDGATDSPAGQFIQVTAGENGACAIRSDDTITCWGGVSMPPPDW